MVTQEHIAQLAELLTPADLYQLMLAMIALRVDGPEPRYGPDLLALSEACGSYEAVQAIHATAPDPADGAPVIHPKTLIGRLAGVICDSRVALAPGACAADHSGRCPTCQAAARKVLRI